MSATDAKDSAPAPEVKQENGTPAPAQDVKPSTNESSTEAAGPTPATNPRSPPPTSAQQAGSGQASANSTSLYVGELDPTVTEAMLYEIFSMVGPVSSIRVCRDAVTRRSLGYAYVNYLNGPDAERALEQLNYSLIKNKACRIMVSQRDPALRKTGAGNIFLKNLDETIDNKALHDTFAAFGNILSCKVALDEAGVSKGYGFVHFDTGDAADAAIANVNGMLLNDKIVFVGHHIPRRERQAKIDEVRSHFTNLYVKNLSTEVTEPEFRELFEKYGQVTSAVVNVDAEGKSKGFGFVNFDKHEDARKAVDELHDKDFRGQPLYVTRAQKKGEREEELRKSYEQAKYEKNIKYQGVNLYVKNLDDDMTDEKLNIEFAPFGTITSCKVMSDDKGVSKGFGFVCFSAPDEATKAVQELNGKMIGNKPLYVSLAQPKDVRQQQLSAQVAQREQMRSQQLAASGLAQMPGGYNMPPGPMPYGAYPGGAGGYPQPGRGPAYPPQNGMMQQQRRPQYAPAGQMPGMPMGQYPPGPPQGYPGAYPGQQQPGRGPPGPMRGYPNGGPPMQPQMQGRGNMPPPGAPPRGPPTNAGPRQGRGPNQRAPEPAQQNGPTITAAALASAGPAEQKQMLGEALYPRIHETVPEMAGKITGMLLEMDNSELLHLLENDEALNGKVSEAIQVLNEYSKAAAGQQEGGGEAAAPATETTA